jgi:hypothetical protein
LAASLQAIECQKLLSGQFESVAVSKQVLIDAAHHKHYVTAFRRNPDCRFEHAIWNLKKLDRSAGRVSLGEALALAPASGGNNGSRALRVEGKPFVRRLTCPACGHARLLLRLECSLRAADRQCSRCGAPAVAAGFDLVEELSARMLEDEPPLTRSLRGIGFRNGEVFSVGERDNEIHFELPGD